jgi:hypothetical protein
LASKEYPPPADGKRRLARGDVEVPVLVSEQMQNLAAPLGHIVGAEIGLDEHRRPRDLLRIGHPLEVAREVVALSAPQLKHFAEAIWVELGDLGAQPNENLLPGRGWVLAATE